jgi:hypothetical protein
MVFHRILDFKKRAGFLSWPFSISGNYPGKAFASSTFTIHPPVCSSHVGKDCQAIINRQSLQPTKTLTINLIYEKKKDQFCIRIYNSLYAGQQQLFILLVPG